MQEKRYDTILMLSGGKDSTYLAYQLTQQKKKILAYTNDVGFMTDVAKANIDRVQEELGLDHFWQRSRKDEHAKIIEEFRQNESWGLPDVCGKCSFLTLKGALELAVLSRVGYIVGGFTKYSTGSPPSRKMLMGGIIYHNPYYDWYDWGRICQFLEDRNYVTDPTVTNCTHIHEIIQTHTKRFGENPYQKEFDALFGDGQLSAEEVQRFNDWCLAPVQSIAEGGK